MDDLILSKTSEPENISLETLSFAEQRQVHLTKKGDDLSWLGSLTRILCSYISGIILSPWRPLFQYLLLHRLKIGG